MNKDFFKSHAISTVIGCLLILIAILAVFQAGVFVGYRRAAFSYNWNSNYMRGINDPHSIFSPFSRDGDEASPHGVVGTIISVRLPVVLIKGPNNAEEVVNVASTTIIRRFHEIAAASDLAAGEQVIVIGEPNDQGQVNAGLIRILPPMGTGSSTLPLPK